MPRVYTPNPDNFPDKITLPTDGDGPGLKAADFDPGFEGVADSVAWLRRELNEAKLHRRALSAINWQPFSAIADTTLVEAAYDDVCRWYVVSPENGAPAYVSPDNGRSWYSFPRPDTVLHDVAARDGSSCIAGVYRGAFPEGELVSFTNLGSRVQVGPSIDWAAPIRVTAHPDGWCIAALKAGEDSVQLYTSADGASWTAKASPRAEDDLEGFELLCHLATSRLVWIGRTTGGDWHVATSDDMGASWTQVSSPDLGAGTWRASIDQGTGRVFVTVYTEGPETTTLYRSDDHGETFSEVVIPGHALDGVAVHNGLAVGAGWVSDFGNVLEFRLVYSTDGGNTWLSGGHVFRHDDFIYLRPFAGAGGFLVAGGERAWGSMRVPPVGHPLT